VRQTYPFLFLGGGGKLGLQKIFASVWVAGKKEDDKRDGRRERERVSSGRESVLKRIILLELIPE
jgi:hypothetical protein